MERTTPFRAHSTPSSSTMSSLFLLGCLVAAASGTGVLVNMPEEILEKLPFAGPNIASPKNCADTDLLHCQVLFNTKLGINNELDWHKPYFLHYALQNIYQTQQQQGVINVCAAYTSFVQCLGTEYSSCINPLYFLKHGYGLTNSYVYPAILAGLHFQCGGGLETLLGNFNCINGGMSAYNTTIQGCIATYHMNMASNPAQGCQWGQQLITCVRAPFGANCNPPSSWYECEYTRAGIALHLPYCDPTAFRCFVAGHALPQQRSSPHLDKQTAFQDALASMSKSSAKVFKSIANADAKMKAAKVKATS